MIVDGAAVNACLVLAREAPGRDIVTIEGLSRAAKLHPIQQALVEHGGTQCGFCTPGIVLSAKALLDGNPSPTTHDVRHAIAGNICRCTGYDKIVDAILAAAATGTGALAPWPPSQAPSSRSASGCRASMPASA